MLLLIAGLVLFLGTHSTRLFASDWRASFIQNKGENVWKGLYTVVSLAGLVLIVFGYGASRADPVFLWDPPVWTRHAAALLVLFASILLAASNIPRNHLKARLGHPMYAGVKLWALAHLMTNGRLGDGLLFGGFLVWAIVGFSISRKRDRLAGVSYGDGNAKGTAITVGAGLVGYGVFAMFLHRLLIGVSPF